VDVSVADAIARAAVFNLALEISSKSLERRFDRFHRLDSARSAMGSPSWRSPMRWAGARRGGAPGVYRSFSGISGPVRRSHRRCSTVVSGGTS